jgi:lysophospholipase L1-like esterase
MKRLLFVLALSGGMFYCLYAGLHNTRAGYLLFGGYQHKPEQPFTEVATHFYINDIPDPLRFENDILLFEREDAENHPPVGATLFIGSSSIRLWSTISTDFPHLTIINRGFGGSHTSDVLHYFDRIVTPYQPATIIYFAGTNDLAAGLTPERVVGFTEEFIRRVNELWPHTRIFILSNTIAVSRKHLYENYHKANQLLEEVLTKYPNATYVDVTSPGLITYSKPRPDIYTSDSLHLNAIGYRIWKEILTPFLD